MKQGFTLTDEKDPVKRLRNLQKSRSEIWERVIVLLDQGQIISHEIDELTKETKKVNKQ